MSQTQIPIRVTSGELVCEGLFEIKGKLATDSEIDIVVHVINGGDSANSYICRKSNPWYIELRGGVPCAFIAIEHWFKHNNNDQHNAVADDNETILEYANCDMTAPDRHILFNCGDSKSVDALGIQKKSIDNGLQMLALRDGQSLERIAKCLELINEKLLPGMINEISETHLAIDRLFVQGNVRQNRSIRLGCDSDSIPNEYKSRPE